MAQVGGQFAVFHLEADFSLQTLMSARKTLPSVDLMEVASTPKGITFVNASRDLRRAYKMTKRYVEVQLRENATFLS